MFVFTENVANSTFPVFGVEIIKMFPSNDVGLSTVKMSLFVICQVTFIYVQFDTGPNEIFIPCRDISPIPSPVFSFS